METSPKFVNEPVYVHTNGVVQPYIPSNIRTPRDVYAASLHILFKHVADFHITIVEILAEKYGFSAEEAMNSIHEDPRFNSMHVDPIINTMSCFSEDDYKKKQAYQTVTEISECTSALPEEANALTVTENTPVQPKKKTIVRKKKVHEEKQEETIEAVIQTTVTVEQPIISENTIPEITNAEAKAQAIEKAKARAKSRQKKTPSTTHEKDDS
jgi:hypothetical protein